MWELGEKCFGHGGWVVEWVIWLLNIPFEESVSDGIRAGFTLLEYFQDETKVRARRSYHLLRNVSKACLEVS